MRCSSFGLTCFRFPRKRGAPRVRGHRRRRARGSAGKGAEGLASPAPHPLVAAVQTQGDGGTLDQYVELFNPSDDDKTLDDHWSLVTHSAVGGCATHETEVLFTFGGQVIPAHGHFLLANAGYEGAVAPDAVYGGVVDASARVTLRQSGHELDVLCFSTAAADTFGCGETCHGELWLGGTTRPAGDVAFERLPGGAAGNAVDTANATNDFQVYVPSVPMNAASAAAPDVSPAVPSTTEWWDAASYDNYSGTWRNDATTPGTPASIVLLGDGTFFSDTRDCASCLGEGTWATSSDASYNDLIVLTSGSTTETYRVTKDDNGTVGFVKVDAHGQPTNPVVAMTHSVPGICRKPLDCDEQVLMSPASGNFACQDGACVFVSRRGCTQVSHGDARTVSSNGAPSPRTSHATVALGDTFAIWGGEDENQSTLGDGAIYDPAADAWSAIASSGAPSPRTGALVMAVHEKLLVLGGYGDRPTFAALADGGIDHPKTGAWTAIPAAPSPVYAQAVIEGHSLVVEGSPWQRLDLRTLTWSNIGSGPTNLQAIGLVGKKIVGVDGYYDPYDQTTSLTYVSFDPTTLAETSGEEVSTLTPLALFTGKGFEVFSNGQYDYSTPNPLRYDADQHEWWTSTWAGGTAFGGWSGQVLVACGAGYGGTICGVAYRPKEQQQTHAFTLATDQSLTFGAVSAHGVFAWGGPRYEVIQGTGFTDTVSDDGYYSPLPTCD